MDPSLGPERREATVLQAYLMIFWAPAMASAVLLWLLWRTEALSTRQGLVLTAGWVVAAILQFGGGSPARWATGLVLFSMIGVYLAIRWKLPT